MHTPSTASPPTTPHGDTVMAGRVRSGLDAATALDQRGSTHDGMLPAFAQGPSRTSRSHQAGSGTCR